ncbi:MAG: hypothetical protein HZA04_03320 [Nitrospinae bacterium]|nr:hypothetical protein [Nitrospinota bacterium]
MKEFEGGSRKERISRTFHLEMDQLEPLQQASQAMGVSQSEVVRRSINYFIQRLARYQQRQLKKKSSNA